jgi:nucleotide-binding universal stress UspA family protein
MTTEVVRVFAPAGPGRRSVLAWARRQARRSGARLEVLVDPDPERDARPVASPGRLVEWAFGTIAGRPSPMDRLSRAAAGARLLVVPQRVPGVDELVGTAYESVTVVPDDTAHPHGPVVLALATGTRDAVVDTAFEAASRRGSPLLAVRCEEDVADAPVDATDSWEDRLTAWRIAYPQVPVEARVAVGDPASELVELSARARLLVLGRSARGRLRAALAPSPVPRVVRRARCPVLVVAPPGPPHRGWWRSS